MKKIIKKSVLLIMIIVLVMSMSSCRPSDSGEKPNESSGTETVQSGEVKTLRLGHVLAPTHPYTLGGEKFAELVNEKTNGGIEVEVFHSSQLGNERDMIEGLQLGTLEMAIVSTAPLSSFLEEFLVFDLPFIFNNEEHARTVLDGDIGTELMSKLDGQKIVGLAYWENGFRHVTNNERRIEKPEDLQGLKIRTMENPIHMATFTQMGADPTPMAFGELFTALQQKTIDGQENPLPIIDSSKYYEVQNYCSLTGHFYAPAPLLISKATFEELTPEEQTAIKEAAAEARDYERQLIDEMNAELIEGLTSKNMEIIEVDKTLFSEAVSPVYEQFSDKVPTELVEEIRAIGN